jgi:hypothetical protein
LNRKRFSAEKNSQNFAEKNLTHAARRFGPSRVLRTEVSAHLRLCFALSTRQRGGLAACFADIKKPSRKREGSNINGQCG